MKTPTNSALHMMEGQGADALACVKAILYQCDRGNVSLPWLIAALRGIEACASIAPKTALSHFADEVEASGEAEKHADEQAPEKYNRAGEMAEEALAELCAMEYGLNEGDIERISSSLLPRVYDCLNLLSMASKFAIPPSNDVATLQQELALAYEGLERERGINKELAEALGGLMGLECRDRIMPTGKEWDAARAALSKVQP